MNARRVAVAMAVLVAAATASALDADLRKQAQDADPSRRADAARALGRDGSPDAARILADLFGDRDAAVRDAAVVACDAVTDPASVRALAAAAKSPHDLTRRNCAEALGRTHSPAALTALTDLASPNCPPAVQADALDALGGFRDDAKAAAAAVAAAGDADPSVRAAAIEAVGRIRGDGAIDVVRKALADPDDGVRCVARATLRAVAPPEALAGLTAAATDPSWRVRAQCVDDAAALRERAGIDVLVELVGDKNTRVAAAAHRAAQALTGKQLGRDPEIWAAWWRTNRGAWTALVPSDAAAPDDPHRTSATYHGLEVASDAAVFVADLSGSMKEPAGADGRSRWTVAAAELRSTLALLPESFVTNLVFFQQQPHAALPRAQALTKVTREKLEAFIASGSPAHEGDLLGGVLAALAEPDSDTVFVLSDGAPTAGEMVDRGRVRAAIRQRNRTRKFVVDTIAFGARKAADRGFLESVARDAGGRCVLRGDGGK